MHGFKGVLCHQSESDYSQENHTLSSSFRPSAGPEQESVFWDLGVGLKVEVLGHSAWEAIISQRRYTHL